MKTENIVVLAALGFGAFYLAKRQAGPGGRTINPQQQAGQQANQTGSLIAQGFNAFRGLFGGGTSTPTNNGYTANPNYVRQVPTSNTSPNQPGYGWQFFDNGTSIDPNGAYFYGGERVWAPDAVAINPPNSYMTQDQFQMNEF